MAVSRKKKKNIFPILVVLVIAAALLTAAILTENRPSREEVNLETYFASREGSLAVIRDDVLTHEDFLYSSGVVYTSVSYLQEQLNKRFYYDKEEKLLLYTVPEGIVRADTETVYKGNPVLREEGGQIYVLLDYAAQFTAVTWTLYRDPDRLVMRTRFGERGGIQAVARTAVRQNARVTSPIMTYLEVGETTDYLQEQAEWNYICTESGIHGYVAKADMAEPITVKDAVPYTDPVLRW